MTPVYILSLLVVVYGDLIVDIDVRSDPPFIDVRNFISTNVISDVERATFGIQDAQPLKTAVAKYTNDNIEPDYVYVKKTGEENDLYAKYPEKFREIKRTVKPKYDAKIVNYNCKLESNASTIKIEWNIKDRLTIPDNITHNIYFDTDPEKKGSAWGEGVSEILTMPGNAECTMTVRIEYEIAIEGDVAVDYTKPRKSKDGDHHYYAYDVVNVQKAAGLRKSVICSETITVIYPKKKETLGSSTTTEPTTTETTTTG